jgi:hypothetical protein
MRGPRNRPWDRVKELQIVRNRRNSNRSRFGKLVEAVKISQKCQEEEPQFSSADNSDCEQLYITGQFGQKPNTEKKQKSTSPKPNLKNESPETTFVTDTNLSSVHGGNH